MMQLELPIKISQKDRILNLLKANDTATSRDLNNICYRYSARILDLRRDGHIIESKQVRKGFWTFRYIGKEM